MTQIGLERVIGLARDGRLETRWLWAAVRGGWRYVWAVAAGDIADDATAAQRVRTCAACDAADTVQTSRAGLCAVYCGTGTATDTGPTCGCLVGITRDGKPIEPAGKVVVASESCPRARWSSVTR